MSGGGGGGVWNSVACEVGPPSCHVDYRVEFSFLPPVFHLTARRGLFSRAVLYPVEICSYWPLADPVGIRPYWSVASPVGVRRLQSRTIKRYGSAEARNTDSHCVQIEP
jgi:hypothetical protein